MRDRLVEMLNEEMEDKNAEEIKDYNEDGYETSYDLFNCLEDAFDGTPQDKKVKAAEVLLRKIQQVAKEANIISAKHERGSVKMRRRQVKDKADKAKKKKNDSEKEKTEPRPDSSSKKDTGLEDEYGYKGLEGGGDDS